MTNLQLLKVFRYLFLFGAVTLGLHSASYFFVEKYSEVPAGFFAFMVCLTVFFIALFSLNEKNIKHCKRKIKEGLNNHAKQ